MDIFSTHVLNRIVEYLDRPSSFLLDTFFSDIQTSDTEEIYFDIDQSKPRLAPFVSPLVAGQVVTEEGFSTRSFRPAYVKDKRRFNPNAPLKRRIGETIGGSLSPMDRREYALNRSLNLQLDNLTRREEVMAAQALCTGRVMVTGDQYPTQIVDFKRAAEHTITLSGSNQWGEAQVNPLDQLEEWASRIQLTSGAVAQTVVMDPLAWKLFKQSPALERLLDIRRGTQSRVSLDPMVRGNGQQKARDVGEIGDFRVWVYNDVYVDEQGQSHRLLPDYTVLMVSQEQVEGVRCYGVIQDEKANYQAERYFSKSWLQDDPAVRWLLMQSAPLVVPYRPNATLSATVRSVQQGHALLKLDMQPTRTGTVKIES